MEELIAYLQGLFPLSEELLLYLQSILEHKTLHRHEHILKAGRVCSHIYFVHQGLLRCYYIKKEKEVCSWFMKEGDVAFAVHSFYTQQPSYENIQALEECSLYYISYQQLQYIYEHFIEFNVHRGLLTEKYYLLSEQRTYYMRMHRSHERYQFVLDQHPDLIDRVPAKYIASYIGVAMITMSRIRASFCRNHSGRK